MVVEPAENAEEAAFSAFFPDLPGCTTWGETLDELRENAKVAVSEHLAALRDLGKPVPTAPNAAGNRCCRGVLS